MMFRVSDRGCESSQPSVCVDETGMSWQVGEEFRPDECHLCTCRKKGKVKCHKQPVQCPAVPTNLPPLCQVVEGPCCFEIKCSVER